MQVHKRCWGGEGLPLDDGDFRIRQAVKLVHQRVDLSVCAPYTSTTRRVIASIAASYVQYTLIAQIVP
jgi:hypothetical protein